MDCSEKIRAFIALHPPREVIERIQSLGEELRKELGNSGIKWAKVEQLHLTLQFLGYITAVDLPLFQRVFAEVVSKNSEFLLSAASLGCFPSAHRPRVLWVGLTGQTDKLLRLKEDLDRALSPLGYTPESRPFHPHITLARIADISGQQRRTLQKILEQQTLFTAGQFRVQKIDLMQSVLSPQGARYRELCSSPLKTS